MTHTDLTQILRDHVAADEPAFGLDPVRVSAAGARLRRRRRGWQAAVGTLAVAAVTTTVLGLAGTLGGGADDGADGARLDPATVSALGDYDASRMPTLLDERAGGVLRGSVPDLGAGTFRATDDQGQRIPERYWDKASGMSIAYGPLSHRYEVRLLHARSEAEGDARRICSDDLASGYAFRCTVTTSADGDTVVSEVVAVRALDEQMRGGGATWDALTRQELETGEVLPGDPSQRPILPEEVHFVRSVEVVHSETFLTNVSETVQAPDLASADALWEVPVAAMTTIATDPVLVIPRPPIGEGGCPWTLPGTGVTCSTTKR